MENSDYLAVFFHVLLPVAYEVSQEINSLRIICADCILESIDLNVLLQFCPDLVLVSAGFDSAIGDPEVR